MIWETIFDDLMRGQRELEREIGETQGLRALLAPLLSYFRTRRRAIAPVSGGGMHARVTCEGHALAQPPTPVKSNSDSDCGSCSDARDGPQGGTPAALLPPAAQLPRVPNRNLPRRAPPLTPIGWVPRAVPPLPPAAAIDDLPGGILAVPLAPPLPPIGTRVLSQLLSDVEAAPPVDTQKQKPTPRSHRH